MSTGNTKRRPERRDGPVATWDFTLKASDNNEASIAADLRKLAKKWAFQLEEGQSGYRHYQGRLNLIKKTTKAHLLTLLLKTSLKGAHVSKTAGVNSRAFDYVLKLDTKILGPWTDQDPNPERVDPEILLPPKEWQQQIIEKLKGPIDRRKVIIILDEKGGSGKTWLKKYLRYHKLATVIPAFEKAEDIAQMVMCKPEDRAYVIDLARAINPKKLQALWTGIEGIKDGYCYDKRHKFQDRSFPTPHVVVFTNSEPIRTHLSEDRWEIIKIT